MTVFILAAVSADGFIARRHDQLVDWSSPEDKKLFVRLTKQAGVMVMGSHTFDTLGKALPGRQTIVYTHQPGKYQLDGVTTSQAPPRQLVRQVAAQGYSSLAICGGAQIYDQFLQAGVVDELYLVVEPYLFGQGVSLLTSQFQTKLQLLDCRLLNPNTICLHYSIKRNFATH